MAFEVGLPELLLALVVGALIFGAAQRKPSDDDLFRSHLRKEFRRMPVYSAETTGGREAEFIRERLRKRFSIAIVLGLAVLVGAAALVADALSVAQLGSRAARVLHGKSAG